MAREQRRRFEIVDNRNEEFTQAGGRSYLKLPPGLGLFRPPKTGVFRGDVIPFVCTQAHTKFARGQYRAGQYSRPGALYWERTFMLHEMVGPNNDKHVCALSTFDKPCPICERMKLLRQNPATKEAGWELRPRDMQIFLWQPRNDRTGAIDGPIQLWDIKYANFGKQLDIFKNGADQDDYAAYQRFYDPDEGFTIKVNAQEEPTGSGRTYTKFGVLEFKARREPLPDELIEHGYDLDAMVRETPYDQLAAIFDGTGEDAADAAHHQSQQGQARPQGRSRPVQGGYESAPTTGHLQRPPRPTAPQPPAEEPPPASVEPDPFDPPPAEVAPPVPAADTYTLGTRDGTDSDWTDRPSQTWVGAGNPLPGDKIKFSYRGRDVMGAITKVNEAANLIMAEGGNPNGSVLDLDEFSYVTDEEWAAAHPPAEAAAPKKAAPARPAKAAPARPAPAPQPTAAAPAAPPADPDDAWAVPAAAPAPAPKPAAQRPNRPARPKPAE